MRGGCAAAPPVPLRIALREGAEEAGLGDLTPWPDESAVHLVIVPVSAAPQPLSGRYDLAHRDLRRVRKQRGEIVPHEVRGPF
jgi:hypothetical protein